MKELYRILDSLGIAFEEHRHPPVFTVGEAAQHSHHLEGSHSKTLLLRNHNRSHYYLVLVPDEKRADLKALRKKLHEQKLSFASAQEVEGMLHVRPGSVSPFTLMHESSRGIVVIVDQSILQHRLVNFHPNDNTATIQLRCEDFKRFLSSTGHEVRVMDV